MHRASELFLDDIFNLIMSDTFGILLVQADTTDDCYFNNLVKTTPKGLERTLLDGHLNLLPIRIYHLAYNNPDTNPNYARERMDAIYAVFKRWTYMGFNKHHAKDPFKCKDFVAYLDSLNWTKADYLVFETDE